MQASIFTIIILFFTLSVKSQSETGMEQYCFIRNESYTFMPIVHFRNNKNWYAEARYNYEDTQTFSLFLGKNYSKHAGLTCSITPLLGASVGKFQAISVGLNMDVEFNNFYFSSQSQYSFSTSVYEHSFLYNWSEIGFQPFPWFYTGLSIQQTRLYKTNVELEPGILVGLSFRNFNIPFYGFSLMNKNRYFILGLDYTWQHR